MLIYANSIDELQFVANVVLLFLDNLQKNYTVSQKVRELSDFHTNCAKPFTDFKTSLPVQFRIYFPRKSLIALPATTQGYKFDTPSNESRRQQQCFCYRYHQT